jgi:hypothetical protein
VTKAEHKAIINSVCAYRNCIRESNIRLYFQLRFSALFCEECAEILLESNLASKTREGIVNFRTNEKSGVL